jgi:L-aminopeptidase/D-esterase-like protein
MNNSITDVDGIRVGHAQNWEAGTGCTVIIIEKGAVAGVDVRGGAPGTRETDLLDPVNMVQKVHAIYLAGGSAFGIDGASGVMEFLEGKGIGFAAGTVKVPIVPGAVIFDLNVGNPCIRPDREMGYQACLNADKQTVKEGCIGAGTGATVGKYYGISRCMKGGIGTASIKVNELVVGALVVVNALGDIINPETGEILAGTLNTEKNQFVHTNRLLINPVSIDYDPFLQNTTLGVVATNADLTKAEAKRLSMSAHDGFARCILPSHTLYDGDIIFSLSTGTVKTDINKLNALSAHVVSLAIQRAIREASMMFGIPSHNELKRKESL